MYWMQIPSPATNQVLPAKKTGTYQQVLQGAYNFTVIMGEVMKEMANQIKNGFFRLQVLLSTALAEPPGYLISAVQAVLFFSFISL